MSLRCVRVTTVAAEKLVFKTLTGTREGGYAYVFEIL